MLGLELNFHPIRQNAQYNPIKKIDLIPNICEGSLVPRLIDISMNIQGNSLSLSEWIWKKAEQHLPFILTLQHKSNPISQIFYFTINNQYEDTFKYLGRSDEKDPDKQQFLKIFLEANNGYAEAQYQLSLHLKKGLGCEKDFEEAIRYCRLAAEQEHANAMFSLASYQVQVESNYIEANCLMKRFVELNYGKLLNLDVLNAWLKKLDDSSPAYYRDTLQLVHAQCSCEATRLIENTKTS